MYFAPRESTHTYFLATQEHIKRHGKPIAFYSDQLGVFKVHTKRTQQKIMTQFGRGLYELNIDLICANTCQAKGRVERANKTLQDRLLKELRLRGISTIEEANTYLPEYMEYYNARFGKAPLLPGDAHRPLQSHEILKETLFFKEHRTVSHDLTVQHDRIKYLIEDIEQNRVLRRQKIMLYEYPDGSISLYADQRKLRFRKFYDRLQRVVQGEVVENERLSNVLEYIRQEQEKRDALPHRSSRALRKGHLSVVPFRKKKAKSILKN